MECCMAGSCTETLPLTPEQIVLIDQSWKEVSKRIEKHGIQAFLDLFNTHPQAQNSFLKFKKPDIMDPKLEMTLKSHAVNITGTIEKCMRRLKHPRQIADIMQNVGTQHAALESSHNFNVEDRYIVYLARSYIESIASRTKDIWTDQHTEAWRSFFNFLIQNLKIGLKEERTRRRALWNLMYVH